MSTQVGLVVMSYGTPASPEDVESYYTHIRRGRPPTPEQLADLRRRYDAIGGVSPLGERTRDQAAAIARALEADEPGRWRVTLGSKHAPPFLEDAVAALATEGHPRVERIVGLVLAPHWSRGSVGEYHERAAAASDAAGVPYTGVESWHEEPTWIDTLAARVHDELARLPQPAKVLFTAHSLPERILADDPYADQLTRSAAAIADRAGLTSSDAWALAWQSAGRTPEPWRGPDIAEVIRELAASGGWAGVLVCPQGFVSDHLEVLYDLDVDASRVAADAGIAFARTPSLNDDPTVMAALAHRVRALEPS